MTPAPRSGDVMWRIGRAGPLKRTVVNPRVPGGLIELRSSTFSRGTETVNADDVFPDRDACRAEIQRRKQAEERTDG